MLSTFRRFSETDYMGFAGAEPLVDGAPLIAENTDFVVVIGGDPDMGGKAAILEVFHTNEETGTQRSWMLECENKDKAIKTAVDLDRAGLLVLDKIEAMEEAGNMGWMRCI